MNNRTMAIFDADKEFVSEFVNYLVREYKKDYEIFAFTSYDSLKEFAGERHIDILLVSSEVFENKLQELDAGQIIILKDKNTDKFEEYKSVFKYQKATSVMREVLECVEDEQRICNGHKDVRSGEAKIIGVYSPVSRCMKTMFSLTLCDIIGESNNVLYMNFEEYSGLRKVMNKEFIGDLSDLMYFYMQDSEKMLKKYNVIRQNYGNFSFIPPMIFSNDIRNIESGHWKSMIKHVSENTEHNVIVLDLSNMLSDIYDVLHICDDIYMPVCDDFVSVSKVEEFMEVLHERNGVSIADRIHKVNMSRYMCTENINTNINSVVNGAFREFVKSYADETEADDFG